jgi:opacity protein-like surface antigen
MKGTTHILGLALLFPFICTAKPHPVFNMTLGIERATVLRQTTIGMVDPFTNTFIGTNAHNSQLNGGLFLGGESALSPHWHWQYGVRYFQNNSFHVRGKVYQFSDPLYDNLTYHYKIHNRRIMAETKILASPWPHWHPYGVAALGEAINHAHQYYEVPVSSADVPMAQPFRNHTSTTLSSSLGLGIDYNYTDHLRLGVSYRWSRLGSVSLGRTPLQDSQTTIHHPQFRMNELLLELSYVV